MEERADTRRSLEEDIVRAGQFYDNVVSWLGEHVNYPRWIYGVYPSEASVRAIRVDIVPTNDPARRLFEKNGFIYAGDVDLELDIGDIPAFSLYELNF